MARPVPGARGLQDYLPKRDRTADTWAYNNTLDRIRMELPPVGDAGASGCTYFPTFENTWDALDAPGSTSSFRTQNSSKHTIQYTIEDINTDVVVCASGSLNASGWFSASASGTRDRRTQNGTYAIHFDGMAKYMVFAFWSESGGTSARITPMYLGGQ